MKTILNKITAKVWVYPGMAGWHFVTIEKEDGEELKRQYFLPRRGFGSIPVWVSIGKTRWKTSVFPEKEKTFLLPLKKAVRDAEAIHEGDTIKLTIEVIS